MIADQIAQVPTLRQLGRMCDQDEQAQRPGYGHIDQVRIVGELQCCPAAGGVVQHRCHDDRVLFPPLEFVHGVGFDGLDQGVGHLVGLTAVRRGDPDFLRLDIGGYPGENLVPDDVDLALVAATLRVRVVDAVGSAHVVAGGGPNHCHRGDPGCAAVHITTTNTKHHCGIGHRLLAEIRSLCPDLAVVAETDTASIGFYLATGFTATSLGERYPGVERFQVLLNPSSAQNHSPAMHNGCGRQPDHPLDGACPRAGQDRRSGSSSWREKSREARSVESE